MNQALRPRNYDLVPGVDITHEELEDFDMPHVEVGMNVYWWEGGMKSGRRPAIVVVTRKAGRNIDVFNPVTRISYDHVRHIEDPKLRLNAEQRDMGAWERIPADLLVDQRLDNIEAQLETAMDKLNALSSGKSSGNTSDYQGLLRRAKALGIPFASNPKKDWLVKKIEEAEAATIADDGNDV